MKKLFLILFASLCVIGQAFAQDWINYNSNEGKFTVALPVEPSVQTDTSRTTPKYITKVVLSRHQGEMFVIGWVDYEPSFKFDDQKELEGNRDNFIKSINGTLLETKNTAFRGYKALEFTATAGSWFWTSKVFIIGRRPYQLVVGSNTGKPSENENKFYNSFLVSK
jgi:hypothetical protein